MRRLILATASLLLPMVQALAMRAPLLAPTQCKSPECVFAHVKKQVKTSPRDGTKESGVLQLHVGPQAWVVDLTQRDRDAVYRGQHASADVTISVATTSDLVALLDRSLSPLKAIMQRRLELRGDVDLLRRAAWLWPSASRKKRFGGNKVLRLLCRGLRGAVAIAVFAAVFHAIAASS